MAQSVKNPSAIQEMPVKQETWGRSLDQEDILEKEIATYSIILAWEIPWVKEPGRLQPAGTQESDTTRQLDQMQSKPRNVY